jgi:hypothetical protein
MKEPSHFSSHEAPPPAASRKARLRTRVLCASSLALSCALFLSVLALFRAPPPKAAEPEAPFEDAPELRELAWEAILRPQVFNTRLEPFKTDEERQAEAFSQWAILNPDEYHRQFVATDPAAAAAETQAAVAVTQPILATAQFEAQQSPESRALSDAARLAILQPATAATE